MDIFADRASCRQFWSNQLRPLLSVLAYTLMEGLRRLALGNTALAVAGPNHIRLTRLRVGAVVLCNTRRIRLLLSSVCPYPELFHMVAVRLNTSTGSPNPNSAMPRGMGYRGFVFPGEHDSTIAGSSAPVIYAKNRFGTGFQPDRMEQFIKTDFFIYHLF